MDKIELKKHLENGLSYRKIASICNCSPKKVEYWVNKYELKECSKFNIEYRKNIDHQYFNKIDTKEKAYILGFFLGDGYIGDRYDVSLGVALNDKEIIEKINNALPWDNEIKVDKTLNKKTRRFPRVRYCFRSRNIGRDLIKHCGNRLALERRTPRISKKFEIYMLSGFFDADGCITWGYRKDRDRLWHKVSFTASLSILTGIQKILLKHGISTMIKPKKNENVYIIEFANKMDILKFYNLLPNDSIRLNRKVKKFNQLINVINASLRPESDEFGENSKKSNTEPRIISE